MHAWKSGYVILGIGILLAVFSLTADYLGFGEGGIQAAQLLGAEVGVVVALLGWGIILARRNGEFNSSGVSWQSLVRILDLPTIVWVILGFLIIYLLLFIFPSLFNPEHRIQYFNRFIPDMVPIGHDLTYSTDIVRNWLVSGRDLYGSQYQVYPPLFAVVFAPFLLLSYPADYYLMTVLTLGCMVALFFLFPALFKLKNSPSLFVFFSLTAIGSYGMLFELERGQFNILAFTLGLAGIYLFHQHASFRHMAYLLFSVSVQLKVYPAILAVMFVKDWRDWKENLLRLTGLGVLNIALLFVLGRDMFLGFLRMMMSYAGATWSRPYNHSIRSFVYEWVNSDSGFRLPDALAWMKENLFLIELLLMAYFFVCLFIVIAKAYKIERRGINFDLLLICTIGAMLLPSVSIDYKLPLLAPALAMALVQRPMQARGLRKILTILLVIILSASYSVTLFSFIDRPNFPANSLPMLLMILTAITFLNFLDSPAPVGAPSLEEMSGEMEPSG